MVEFALGLHRACIRAFGLASGLHQHAVSGFCIRACILGFRLHDTCIVSAWGLHRVCIGLHGHTSPMQARDTPPWLHALPGSVKITGLVNRAPKS